MSDTSGQTAAAPQILPQNLSTFMALTSPQLREPSDTDAQAALMGQGHPVRLDPYLSRAAGYAGRMARGVFNLALTSELDAQMSRFDLWRSGSHGSSARTSPAPVRPGKAVQLSPKAIDRRRPLKPGRGPTSGRGAPVTAGGSSDDLRRVLNRPEQA